MGVEPLPVAGAASVPLTLIVPAMVTFPWASRVTGVLALLA